MMTLEQPCSSWTGVLHLDTWIGLPFPFGHSTSLQAQKLPISSAVDRYMLSLKHSCLGRAGRPLPALKMAPLRQGGMCVLNVPDCRLVWSHTSCAAPLRPQIGGLPPCWCHQGQSPGRSPRQGSGWCQHQVFWPPCCTIVFQRLECLLQRDQQPLVWHVEDAHPSLSEGCHLERWKGPACSP